jgi:hypothetical protein
MNAIRNVKPINAFVATGEQGDTGGGIWGKLAYVSPTWATQFIALDALDLPKCDLIKIDVDGKELDVLQSAETQVERHRPVIYFENDVREASEKLLSFAIDTLGYDLYWHPAPIFDESNFFGNPENHWAPRSIVSLMVLAVPKEWQVEVAGLARVKSAGEWWQGL